MLAIILSSMRYLARQGLALSKADDSESNLIKLLELRAEDNAQITNWLAKGRRIYRSHENQNEMLTIMVRLVQSKILHKIHKSLMVDETTDVHFE